MHFQWTTTLLLLLAHAQVKGQADPSEEIINVYRSLVYQISQIQPEVDNTCYITQTNTLRALFVICPTDFECHVHPYLLEDVIRVKLSSKTSSEDVCKTLDDKPLPSKKKRQLNAVISFFGLMSDSTCELSSVETLIATKNILNRNLKLNKVNCHGECPPYRLRHLHLFSFNIEDVSNNSLCQFGQLEYLTLAMCGIESIDEDAFVWLVKLKSVALNGNNLTHLPTKLFRNNVRLQYIFLNDNRLLSHVTDSFLTIDTLRLINLSNTSIDFSTKNVTFPSSLEVLLICNNKLRGLKLELKSLSKLTKFEMHNNRIVEVDEDAFQDLLEVQLINLAANDIERLSGNTFKNTIKLRELRLSANKLSELPPIGHLAYLKTLKLADNRISSINENNIINCTRLSVLDLSNNQISFIEEGSFCNVYQLDLLNLDYNLLSKLPADFKTLSVLRLDLRYNYFASFSYKMVPFGATEVNVSYNRIETIEAFNFKGQTWSLIHLNLSHNQIESIEKLTLPPSIRDIDLSCNKIRQVFSASYLKNQKLNNLRSIDLRDNNILSLCRSLFEYYFPHARVEYYLARNPFQCNNEIFWIKHYGNKNGIILADLNQTFCRSMMPYDNGKPVHLHDINYYYLLSRSDFANSDRCLCPPEEDIKCQLSCPYNCTCLSDDILYIIYLMCDNRKFQQIPNHLMYPHEYKDTIELYLDFGRNFITRVALLSFGILNEKIVALRLANCRIKVIDTNAFDKINLLEDLSLASNQLDALPDGLFHKLNELRTLDLSNNRIVHLANGALVSVAHLKHLKMHNNSLTHLGLDQILVKKFLKTITLHDNPWSCDCAFIVPFQTFLANLSIPTDVKGNISCTKNQHQRYVESVYQEDCLIQLIYLDQSITLIVALTFAILFKITAGLVFKWRYELQVLVYSRYGLRMFHKRQPEEDEGKLFDAFMAYNSKDGEFLVEQLLPGLEGIENPYRILIHNRDFLAGGFIQDNIIEAINISSRTIILLSENFVDSGWCRFEFKTAHAQMMEDRCPRVLVIVLFDIPETLDPEMKLYLNTNTYLKWGERLFWQKLYYAMSDKRVITPPTDVIPMREL